MEVKLSWFRCFFFFFSYQSSFSSTFNKSAISVRCESPFFWSLWIFFALWIFLQSSFLRYLFVQLLPLGSSLFFLALRLRPDIYIYIYCKSLQSINHSIVSTFFQIFRSNTDLISTQIQDSFGFPFTIRKSHNQLSIYRLVASTLTFPLVFHISRLVQTFSLSRLTWEFSSRMFFTSRIWEGLGRVSNVRLWMHAKLEIRCSRGAGCFPIHCYDPYWLIVARNFLP